MFGIFARKKIENEIRIHPKAGRVEVEVVDIANDSVLKRKKYDATVGESDSDGECEILVREIKKDFKSWLKKSRVVVCPSSSNFKTFTGEFEKNGEADMEKYFMGVFGVDFYRYKYFYEEVIIGERRFLSAHMIDKKLYESYIKKFKSVNGKEPAISFSVDNIIKACPDGGILVDMDGKKLYAFIFHGGVVLQRMEFDFDDKDVLSVSASDDKDIRRVKKLSAILYGVVREFSDMHKKLQIHECAPDSSIYIKDSGDMEILAEAVKDITGFRVFDATKGDIVAI